MLMAARDSDGSGLSEQEVRDEISTFLVAGHETTAMALTWSLALLSAYRRPGSGWKKRWMPCSATARPTQESYPGPPR
jgi:cytochrome P450